MSPKAIYLTSLSFALYSIVLYNSYFSLIPFTTKTNLPGYYCTLTSTFFNYSLPPAISNTTTIFSSSQISHTKA